METVTEALARLREAGFVRSFQVRRKALECIESKTTLRPDEVTVDKIVRIEGDSNPAEQTLILGLRVPKHEFKGTLTVPFGPAMATEDQQLVTQLLERSGSASRD